MRKALSAVAALAAACGLAAGAGAGPSSAGIATARLTRPMTWLVQHGGYGSFPIASLDQSYRPGDLYYLVRTTGAVDASFEQALTLAGARVRGVFPETGYAAVASPSSALAAVSQLPQVVKLDADRPRVVLKASARLAPASYADQTKRGTHDVGADTLWAAGDTGAGVTVGVVDSGIDSTHPDLSARLRGFVNCMGVVPTLLSDDAGVCVSQRGFDDNGHGTHVSGIAVGAAVGGSGQAGLYPGMAPGAGLVGAKVCNPAGSCLTSSIMAGVRYLALKPVQGGLGADVINLSLGSDRFYLAGASGAEQVTNDDALDQEMNALAQLQNVLFTVAAGNSGPTLQSVGNPADASQVLAVGASIADWDLAHPRDETAHGELGAIRPEAAAAGATGIAQFSSRGPSGDRLVKPDVTAPGVYVISAQAVSGAEIAAGDTVHDTNFSTDPTYAVLSGTSMAAPSAAGVAALVWSGYESAVGSDPAYFRLKAALANTAGTRAYEGSSVGLISGIKAERAGMDPSQLFPVRNQTYVGVTGEGAGRVNAPAALQALTSGVTVYTPQTSLSDIRELQPSWSLDDVAPGESRSQQLVLHGSPKLAGNGATTFSVTSETEPQGVLSAPSGWIKVPGKSVTTAANKDKAFTVKLVVPSKAKPGMYEATIVGTAKLGNGVTQQLRIPVQFFVPAKVAADGTSALEGPIWANDVTDYTAVGFESPLGGIFTDWTNIPLRVPAGTIRIDLSVYDVAGNDHMDVFAFDSAGNEINSTVSADLLDEVPGGAGYAPTTKDSPETVSLFDGTDWESVSLPTTIWLDVSDSAPGNTTAPIGFSTYHLDVQMH